MSTCRSIVPEYYISSLLEPESVIQLTALPFVQHLCYMCYTPCKLLFSMYMYMYILTLISGSEPNLLSYMYMYLNWYS